MQSVETDRYVILVLLQGTWCFLHSAMISLSFTRYLKRRLGASFRFYRLFYNVFAVLTSIPVLWFAWTIRTAPLFDWHGYWRVVQAALLGTAAVLFYSGARHYSASRFVGLRQIREGVSGILLSEKGDLDTSGILGVVRHPWYLGAIPLVWARPLDVSAIVMNVVFTVYLVAGCYIEEKKLLIEFGDGYREYQKRVSMLIPIKWLTTRPVNRGN